MCRLDEDGPAVIGPPAEAVVPSVVRSRIPDVHAGLEREGLGHLPRGERAGPPEGIGRGVDVGREGRVRAESRVQVEGGPRRHHEVLARHHLADLEGDGPERLPVPELIDARGHRRNARRAVDTRCAGDHTRIRRYLRNSGSGAAPIRSITAGRERQGREGEQKKIADHVITTPVVERESTPRQRYVLTTNMVACR